MENGISFEICKLKFLAFIVTNFNLLLISITEAQIPIHLHHHLWKEEG